MATSEEKPRSKNAQREQANARNRHRYATDPEYRAYKLAGARRSKRKANLKQRYSDPQMQAELAKPETRREIASRILTDKTVSVLKKFAKKTA